MVNETKKLTRREALKGIFLASAAGAFVLFATSNSFSYFSKSSPNEKTRHISPANSENVSTSEIGTYASSISSQSSTSVNVTIKVVYFGMSYQMTGTKEEYFTLQTPAFLQDLISLIDQKHVVFATMLPTMQVVVDGVPAQGNPQLQDKNEVDFIPLFAGG